METFGTWIVGAVLGLVLAFAAYRVYKNRKDGKGCGSGCENCACHCPSKEGTKGGT